MHLPAAAAPQLVLPYVYGPLFAFSDPKLVVFGVWGSVGGFLSVSLILLRARRARVGQAPPG